MFAVVGLSCAVCGYMLSLEIDSPCYFILGYTDLCLIGYRLTFGAAFSTPTVGTLTYIIDETSTVEANPVTTFVLKYFTVTSFDSHQFSIGLQGYVRAILTSDSEMLQGVPPQTDHWEIFLLRILFPFAPQECEHSDHIVHDDILQSTEKLRMNNM